MSTNKVAISSDIMSSDNYVAASSNAVYQLYNMIQSIISAIVVEEPTILSSSTNLVIGYDSSISVSSQAYLANASISKFEVVYNIGGTEYSSETTTVSDDKGTLTLTIPSSVVEGEQIDLYFRAYDNLGNMSPHSTKSYTAIKASVTTPSITTPSSGLIVHPKSFTLTTSTFSSNGYEDTLKSVGYKICSDSTGNTILTSGTMTSINGSITLSTKMTSGSTYYVFVKHTGNVLGDSAWSAGIKIVASQVNTPSITSPASGTSVMVSSGLTIISSAFSCTGGISDTHSSTDWKVTSDSAGSVVIAQAMGSSDKTSHTFNGIDVTGGNTYYAWVRYNSANCGTSAWVSVDFVASAAVTTAGGRTLYRHSSGMGTVMEFNDGSPRKVIVLDAQYRGCGAIASDTTDTALPNYQSKNSNSTWYINGGSSSTTCAACASVTDATLNSLWASSIDANTSKYNTDVWIGYSDSPAAQLARGVIVDGEGCDIPNLQTLMRIYCEAEALDAMDPTVSSYTGNALGSANTNGSWYIAGYNYSWSSTEYASSYCRLVFANGFCFCDSKSVDLSVVPVLEI